MASRRLSASTADIRKSSNFPHAQLTRRRSSRSSATSRNSISEFRSSRTLSSNPRVRDGRPVLLRLCPRRFSSRQSRVSLKTSNAKEARRKAILLEGDIISGRFQARSEVATVVEAVAAYREGLRTERRAAKTITKYDTILDRVSRLAHDLWVRTMDRMNLSFMDRYRSIRLKAGLSERLEAQNRRPTIDPDQLRRPIDTRVAAAKVAVGDDDAAINDVPYVRPAVVRAAPSFDAADDPQEIESAGEDPHLPALLHFERPSGGHPHGDRPFLGRPRRRQNHRPLHPRSRRGLADGHAASGGGQSAKPADEGDRE